MLPAVDTHVHLFARHLRPVQGARYVPAYEARIESLFGLQEASGVTHAVLVQPSFLGTDNSHLLAALEAHPTRLRATLVVDTDVPRASIRRWDDLGARGIRLNLFRMESVPDFSAPEWRALFSSIAAYGWHVEVHASDAQMDKAVALLGACPAPLVFDHFGRPGPASGAQSARTQALLGMAAHQSIFIKLSAPYRMAGGDARQHARFWLERLGAERLMWGSDWPWTNFEQSTTYAECVSELARWVPDEADRRRILWDTPKRLFRF